MAQQFSMHIYKVKIRGGVEWMVLQLDHVNVIVPD